MSTVISKLKTNSLISDNTHKRLLRYRHVLIGILCTVIKRHREVFQSTVPEQSRLQSTVYNYIQLQLIAFD